MCKLVKNKFEVLKMVFSTFLAIVVLTSQAFAVGWYSENGYWYYQDANGQFVRGESRIIDGNYYWFNPNGAMATDGTCFCLPIEKDGKANLQAGRVMDLGDNVKLYYPSYVNDYNPFDNKTETTYINGVNLIGQSLVDQTKRIKFNATTNSSSGLYPDFYMVVLALDNKTILGKYKESKYSTIRDQEWLVPYSNCIVYLTTNLNSITK